MNVREFLENFLEGEGMAGICGFEDENGNLIDMTIERLADGTVREVRNDLPQCKG